MIEQFFTQPKVRVVYSERVLGRSFQRLWLTSIRKIIKGGGIGVTRAP